MIVLPTATMLDIRLDGLTPVPGNTGTRKSSPSLTVKREGSVQSIQAVTEERDAARREQTKLQQAIYEAAQAQRRLCSPRELVWGEFEIAGEIFPVRHLSGDFFKVMELDSALGFAVGDIAGKGLTAGIWQTHMMGLAQRYARTHADPGVAIAHINQELWQDHDEPPLTALFLARLDPKTDELVYCNAGLPAPLLLRHGKDLERLEEGGPMLGAVQNATFNTGRVRLNAGDMLIAYSDGATECSNSRDEEFGTNRLAITATAVSGASANQALFSTLAAVLDFAGARPPEDDLTLLVVRRRGVVQELHRSRGKNFSTPHGEEISVERPKKSGRRGNGSKRLN